MVEESWPTDLKERSGDMPDRRSGPGDTAVNISGQACLQGAFAAMGKGEQLGTLLVVLRDEARESENNGWGEGQHYK